MTLPAHLKNDFKDNFKDDGKTLADFIPGATFTADGSNFSATAGLECEAPFADREQLTEALKTIYDPEIPVNIYDLGLIYRMEQAEAGAVAVDMTLTAPGCPVAGTFPGLIAETLAALPGVGIVTVTLVWEPPWTKDKMSDDARMALEI